MVAVFAAAIAIAACDRLVDPLLPSDAEQFSPPAVYSTWWNMTQACSGHTAPLEAVTWYKTDEQLRDPHTGEVLTAYWSAASNRIALMSNATLNGSIVRHEMLHALLRVGGHPRNEFLGKCAGTVDCESDCVADAGPYPKPPQSPIQVPGDSIEITVDVEPKNPTFGYDGGFFSITVTARNRSSHWATAIPAFFPTDTAHTFSFAVVASSGTGRSSDEMAFDPSERIFAPGESKKHVYDFRIGDDPFGAQLSPGTYSVRGGYAEYWSSFTPFVVGP